MKNKKKIGEFSTLGLGGWWVHNQSFSTQKDMVLKHWILPNNQFETNLFFQFLDEPKAFSLDLRP